MKKKYEKSIQRSRRKTGIRKRVIGTPQRPRMTVYRSLNHMYVQIVDDIAGRTLVSASSIQAKMPSGGNKDAAAAVGKDIAQKATGAGLKKVAFDRNGFKFHGRIKALADAAREAGLSF